MREGASRQKAKGVRKTAIELNNVSFSYGERQVLDGFSLCIGEGDRVCLTGASGCGKTTVLRLVLGLIKPSVGTVKAPKRISAVFQEDRLFKTGDVLRQISVTGTYDGARELLGKAGMSDIAHMHIDELSGGMRRRVALLRALNFDADAIVLDEPFNGIDEKNRETAARLILEKFGDKPILLISHIADDAKLLEAVSVDMEQIQTHSEQVRSQVPAKSQE